MGYKFRPMLNNNHSSGSNTICALYTIDVLSMRKCHPCRVEYSISTDSLVTIDDKVAIKVLAFGNTEPNKNFYFLNLLKYLAKTLARVYSVKAHRFTQ